jgi:signal peptidase II
MSWRIYLLALAVVVLDQLTKMIAVEDLIRHHEVALTPFFNLTLVFNTGAAFGFLGDAGGWQNVFFISVAMAATVFIYFVVRKLKPHEKLSAAGFMLILGGAIGNVIDRVRHGYVIDFLDFHVGTWHWPAFNVADIGITVGAGLLIVDTLWGAGRRSGR